MAESHSSDPLATGRVTLLGQAMAVAGAERERVRNALLERFPFQDFSFWSLALLQKARAELAKGS